MICHFVASALIRRAKAAKPSIQSDEDSASVEEVVAVRKTHPGKENNNARKQSNTSSLQQAMDQTAEMSTPECVDIRVKYIQKKKLEIEQLKVVRDGRLKEQAKIDADVRIGQNQFEIVRLIHAHRSEEWEHEDSDSLLECRLRKVMELQKEVGLLRTNVDQALDRLVTLICQELDSEEDVLDQMRESPLKLDEAGSTDLKLLFQDLVGRFLTDQSLLYAAKYHPILIYMLGSIGLISFEENSPERIALAFNRI